MKRLSLSQLFARFFGGKNAPTAFETRLARIFVRRRLMANDPSLRGDPAALNKAYEELDLVVAEEEGENGRVAYELKSPDRIPTTPP